MLTGGPPVIQQLYGISVRTPWPVPNVPAKTRGAWDVEFVEGEPQAFREAAMHVPPDQSDWWTQTAALPDGSRYCRWEDLFEFLVPPDGRRVQVRVLKDAVLESLQACLLVDALSFSLIRLGREPLHATAMLTAEGVVAFLGKSGDGKSTLGALFVHGGGRLVADDMLVLTAEGQEYLAHPGPPRIKLYRDNARRIFGDAVNGVPMNPTTQKLIFPLGDAQTLRHPCPLRAIYVISARRDSLALTRPCIRRLSPGQALPRVLAACATHWRTEPDRLRRQFAFVTRLVQHVPINDLSYPRRQDEMEAVRGAVIAHLQASAR